MISLLNSLGHDGFKICFTEKQTTSNQVFKQNISSLKGGKEKNKPCQRILQNKKSPNVYGKDKNHTTKIVFFQYNKKTRTRKRQGRR